MLRLSAKIQVGALTVALVLIPVSAWACLDNKLGSLGDVFQEDLLQPEYAVQTKDPECKDNPLLHEINIFGNDDRRAPKREDIVAGVGMIFAEGKNDCKMPGSGYIVDLDGLRPNRTYDIIVTDAHNFWLPDGSEKKGNRPLDFFPRGFSGERVKLVRPMGNKNWSVGGEQWAIATVPKRLSKRFGSVAIAAQPVTLDKLQQWKDEGATFFAAGMQYLLRPGHTGVMIKCADIHKVKKVVAPGCLDYANNSGRVIQLQSSGGDFKDSSFILLSCDFRAGMSGGPVVMKLPSGLMYAVMTVSNESTGFIQGGTFVPFRNYNGGSTVTRNLIDAILAEIEHQDRLER